MVLIFKNLFSRKEEDANNFFILMNVRQKLTEKAGLTRFKHYVKDVGIKPWKVFAEMYTSTNINTG